LLQTFPFATGETRSQPLPKGTYVVRGSDNWAQKIVVR
jgi:hypothetical protein